MGLFHIYCGDGKGKTTAAVGLAVRAAGNGMKVHIVQFLKGSPTSELATLNLIPNITVSRLDKNYGFTFNMTDEQKKKVIECHNNLLCEAEEKMNNGSADMIILDEFNAAYKYGLVEKTLADRIILERNHDVELIITGREPDEKFIDAADYVSEIKAVKHPYEKGIAARKGIEF